MARRRRHWSLLLPVLFLGPDPACATTAAGTRISNVAELRTRADGVDRVASSNQVDLIVAELLDVELARTASGGITVPVGGGAVATTLTNRGNGNETVDLSATFDDGSAVVTGFAIDDDGDGRYDPAHDRLLDAARTPVLAGGGRLALLVLVAPASAAAPPTAHMLTINAAATTGSGPPGTTFPARGDEGGEAVVGTTGAMARLVVPLAGDDPAPTLVKTQSVVAPDGSARPLAGAIVTYSLTARFAGPAAAARIADPIPAGTRYVPGSLALDAVALTDAADADPGTADAGTITVALGDIAAAGTRTVRFQVTIQ